MRRIVIPMLFGFGATLAVTIGGRKFWAMIEKFQQLPKAEQIKCNVGGGCMPLVKKQTC